MNVRVGLVSKRRNPWRSGLFAILGILFVGGLVLLSRTPSLAAPVLDIDIVSWNVVGLDLANINNAPNTFTVEPRLCNTGDSPANNIVVTFVWDTTNAYINLSGSTQQTLFTLPAGRCLDFIYKIVVTRDPLASGATRRYHITASADGLGTISSDIPREIVVKGFTPDNNLTVTDLDGPGSINVGGLYTYTLEVSAANTNYGQLVHSIEFPPGAFRVHQVKAGYSAPPNATGDRPYTDACNWQEDPGAGNYLNCVPPPPSGFPMGVVSGTVNVTYTVEVVAAGAYTLTANLYGYSNNSYLYSSDMGQDALNITAAINPNGDSYFPLILKQFGTPATATPTGGPLLPTQTGTPGTATPTATGSITPRPGATKGVAPAEARIGQNFTFTIRVVNTGTAPATNVRLEDSFSTYTYLDIFDLSTTKGTKNITGRVAVVNIGTLDPGEVVTVRIVVRVNNTITFTTSPCNLARVTYGTNGVINSNSQCFRVVGSTTLPPTGELPLEPEINWTRWTGLVLLVVLGAAGMLLVRRGTVNRSLNPGRARLLVGAGSVLVLMALFAGLAACQWFEPAPKTSIDAVMTQEPEVLLSATPSATLNPLAQLPAYMFATPNPDELLVVETLPSYPIPSPSIEATPGAEDNLPDTTAATRMEIPKLNLDAVVAYVPFDQNTWKIQGLREEVAWLGDTSWPGLGGNTAFAGHVTVRGLGNGPFRYLSTLGPGDEIRVYTEKKMYVYKVRELKIVEETDMSVTEPTEGSSQITLITCVDWNETIGIYLKRLVVIADEVRAVALAD